MKKLLIANDICFYCGNPTQAIHVHHISKRSTNPELKKEKKNLCPLCWRCHQRAHTSKKFFEEVKRLWNYQIKHLAN
jgi:5-methylcytosine-specific restriction endonuclease McrA